MDALPLVETKQPFKSIKLEKSNGNTCFDDFGVFGNFSRNFWLFSSPLYHICEYCRSILSKKIGSFRTFLFFKNTIVQFNVLKCLHESLRLSKSIQRAIPQKFRRSASMHIAKNGPFCTTPKYATIVLCSSGALKY